jgi:hypothetical protein
MIVYQWIFVIIEGLASLISFCKLVAADTVQEVTTNILGLASGLAFLCFFIHFYWR